MNISHYDFHDGYLIDIKSDNDKIEISMESAQIDFDDIKGDILLSNRDTLRGKLHLEKVRQIRIDGRILTEKLEKLHDDGDISSLDIEGNKVNLRVCWISYSSEKDTGNRWYTYEIEAEKIFWENIPDLPNPCWSNNDYLDKNGNPVPRGSRESRLYPPEGVSWE